MQPQDLLVRSPDSFTSDDHRLVARAFRDAWGCLRPLVAASRTEEARYWLAELAVERGKYHTRIESLRLDVLLIALGELRSGQSDWDH
jgi:hypothetical protein